MCRGKKRRRGGHETAASRKPRGKRMDDEARIRG
jgi:hypothetical protein